MNHGIVKELDTYNWNIFRCEWKKKLGCVSQKVLWAQVWWAVINLQ